MKGPILLVSVKASSLSLAQRQARGSSLEVWRDVPAHSTKGAGDAQC